MQSKVTVQGRIGLSEALARAAALAGRPSQKDFKFGGPRSCCTVSGRGHRTGPPDRWAIIQSAVTGPGLIGLTKALARAAALAGLPSQKDFKLSVGGPRSCCTVSCCSHRTGPPGRWAIIQSAVTGPGLIRLTEALFISIYIDILRDIHMHYLDIYMWISCSRCGYLSMGMDIHYAIMTRQICKSKYLHKYIDISGYLHRYLHIYLNIMDV